MFYTYKIYDNVPSCDKLRSPLQKVGDVYRIVTISEPKKIKQYIVFSKDLSHILMGSLKWIDLILDFSVVLLNME